VRLENKYLAVKSLHDEKGYPIAILCDVLNLNRSSYYKWLCRDQSKQEADDKELIDRICKLYQESNGIFGYRRMQLNLKRRFHLTVNKKRVYRIMRAIGLQSAIRRKRPNYIRSRPEITAENILNRNFTAENLNEKWLSDITEFKVGDTKLYLCAILDLKDKSIVSFSDSRSPNNKLVFDTLDAAILRNPDARPLFHSDRGSQYTNRIFRTKLDTQGMTQSMSRVGRCIDNGPMEAFWGSIKAEMYYLNKFTDYASLQTAIAQYIEFYNSGRYQEKLGGLAPLELRAMLTAA